MAGRRTLLYLARDFPVPISSAARLRTFNWILHLAGSFEVTFVAPDANVRQDEPGLEVLQMRSRRLLLPRPSTGRRWAQRLADRVLPAAAGSTEAAVLRQKLHIDGIRGAVHAALRQHRFDVVFGEHWTWRDLLLYRAPISVLDTEPWAPPHSLAGVRPDAPEPAERGRHAGSAATDLDGRTKWWGAGALRGRLLQRLRRIESEVMARADLVLVPNRAAREEILRTSGGRTQPMVVPAGLDIGYFAARRARFHGRNVVFLAALDRPTQRDALLYLHRSLLPRVRRRVGEVILTVVATEPAPDLEAALGSDPTVRFTRPALDPRAELGRGAVAVMPERFGPGWPDRLAQLLAMGIPTVATPVAARGLDVASGDGVLIAAGTADFSAAVAQVLLDASLRSDLARRARETAESRLSLDATYGRVTEILARASDSLAGRIRD